MKFNEKLQQLRKERNLSQEALANKLDVSRQSVSKWETGSARPDMEKIVQMCEVLDCKLDDLMDDGIISTEHRNQANNNNLQAYFQMFLNTLTKISNMLSAMSFKDKIKMVFEMMIVAIVYIIFVMGISFLLGELGYSLYSLMPTGLSSVIRNILGFVFRLFYIVVGVIVMIHIFNIRYLDYYVTIEDHEVEEKTIEEPIEKTEDKNYIPTKKEKIIIRDPKHSSNRFLKFLASICIFFIKMFLAVIGFTAIFLLLAACVITGYFLFNINNGFLFFLFTLCAAGIAVAIYPILNMIYNFIFNNPINFRRLLYVLVGGIVTTGITFGLAVALLSTYETIDINSDTVAYTEEDFIIDYSETDHLYLHGYDMNLNYKTDSNLEDNKVIVTLSYPEYYYSFFDTYNDEKTNDENKTYTEHNYHFSVSYESMEFYQLFLSTLKDKKIINPDYNGKIEVYLTSNEATQEMIRNKLD